jgi:hypothetical protein
MTLINQHVEGRLSVGLSPVGADGYCNWGAIDIDTYDASPLQLVRTVYRNNLPLCPCYSKSKGLHLFLFLSKGVPSPEIRELLNSYRQVLGLPKTTELFPLARSNDANPAWINIPFYKDESDNPRKLIGPDGHLMRVIDAIPAMIEKKMLLKEHTEVLENLPVSDGPPCIQVPMLSGEVPPGLRNKWFFNLGVYETQKWPDEPEEVELAVLKVNKTISDPLPEKELLTTILSGMKKHTYFYMCDSCMLDCGCDKQMCTERRFGKDCKDMTGFDIGQLTVRNTSPPTYTWMINGRPLHGDARLFLEQKLFQRKCIETLGIMPRMLKDSAWRQVVNKALQECIKTEIDMEQSMGTVDVLQNAFLSEYIGRSVPGKDLEQVRYGRIAFDGEYYYFAPPSFQMWAIKARPTRGIESVDIWAECLEPLGVKSHPILRGVAMIKASAIPKMPEIENDYHEEEQSGSGY